MDYTLVGLNNTHCFLDDIIIVIWGSKEGHLKLVYNCLIKLYEYNLKINLPKCRFAMTEIKRLGYKFNQSGITPLETRTSAILNPPAPENLKNNAHF